MVVLAYIVLYSMVLFFSYTKFHKVLNITSIFSGIWFVFGSISCFGLYGLRVPRIVIHVYIWVFVLIVDVIFWWFARGQNNNSKTYAHEVIKYSSRAKTIQIIALVLIIPLLVKVSLLFVSYGNLNVVREMYFSGTNFSSMYQDLFFRIIPMGFLVALVVYYTYYSFEIRKYKYLLYALLNAIFVTMINGGRYSLILGLYSIVILWITGAIDLKNTRVVTKYGKRIKRLAVVIVILMLIITISRGQNILKNIILYFSGSLSFLDYIIENPFLFALNQKLYGYLTFGAFLEPIVLLLKVLGVSSAKVPSYEFNIYGQKYYDIGNGSETVLFNANTSIIYYFLRDFGAAGVVIGAIFIGGLSVVAYNKWKRGNRFWGLVFLILGSTLFNSLMTYQLFGPTIFFIVCVFYFCTRKKFVIKRR